MPLLSTRAAERSLAWFRNLRRGVSKWSSASDREFHDALFSVQAHDPYDASYAGNITIRRFAELAAEYLGTASSVLDLGCGPAEITCELARRCPGVRFHGVDHSAMAIEQAQRTAQKLRLANVTFETADAEGYTPAAPVDLVTMFDAFHHLLDPAAFVTRLGSHATEFLLIEPAGDALGRWRRTLDFDWIPIELDKIRARAEHELGIQTSRRAATPAEGETHGTAVENRYPISDYEKFFAGYQLEVRGTAAGLDAYPPDPSAHSALRSEVMEAAYRLLTKVDADLYERGLDLHAKHWVIFAARETRPGRRPRPRVAPPATAPAEGVRVGGPWDARYENAGVPATIAPGAEVLVDVTVCNDSWRAWMSDETDAPVNLSYHWIGPGGLPAAFDGVRTPLRRAIPPGETLRMSMVVRAPSAVGRYELQIDLVEEGVTWFSRAGTPPFRASVRVG